MSYATVRGGERAIEAAGMLENAAAKDSGLSEQAVRNGLGYAVDAAMGEAGLHAPALAAQAIVQAHGDLAEAAFLLRAYRSTLPRIGYTLPADPGFMRLVRRISSVFKDVPGGQILGATRDYSQRLLGLEHAEPPTPQEPIQTEGEGTLPRVTGLLREAGLVAEHKASEEPEEPPDLTRQALKVPTARSGRLQSLARGETGAMSALAYSSLRGFGPQHPALAEFRVGHLPLKVEHPYLGEEVEIGEVLCTEAETAGPEESREAEPESKDKDGTLSLGYGLVFGRNERKAISMAVLDAAIRAGNKREQGPGGPAEDEEFVLYHTDGVEISGFIEHLKLPHYVTFQSSLDRLREVRSKVAGTHED